MSFLSHHPGPRLPSLAMDIMTARLVLGCRRVELRGKRLFCSSLKLSSAKVRQTETKHAIPYGKSYELQCVSCEPRISSRGCLIPYGSEAANRSADAGLFTDGGSP